MNPNDLVAPSAAQATPVPAPVVSAERASALADETLDTIPLPPSAHAGHPDAAPEPAVTTWITKEGGHRRLPFERARLLRSIREIHSEFPHLALDEYARSILSFVERKDSVNADDLVDHMIREAEARVDVIAPDWEFFAARLYLKRLYKRASKNRFYDAGIKYGSYVGLQESLADRNVYSIDILKNYSKEELEEAGRLIDPERDKL